jgi:hypothetical protein
MRITTLVCFVCAGTLGAAALAAPPATYGTVPTPAALDWQALLLSQTAAALPLSALAPQATTTPEAAPEERSAVPAYGHRGATEFFNVREAYSDVTKGMWEFGVTGTYSTQRAEKHDFFGMTQYLLYGITDDMNLEVTVAEPMGYGGEGVGELGLRLFNTFWHEGEILPAFGGAAQLRIPTGFGSSNVDGVFTGTLTKTLCSKFRANFQGQVAVASGAQGQNPVANRRPFQWSVGPGFDYQLCDNTLVLLNYLQKSSDYDGQHNNNIMEAGVVHSFPKTGMFKHTIKAAVDWTLDGQATTPNFAAKLLWAVDW